MTVNDTAQLPSNYLDHSTRLILSINDTTCKQRLFTLAAARDCISRVTRCPRHRIASSPRNKLVYESHSINGGYWVSVADTSGKCRTCYRARAQQELQRPQPQPRPVVGVECWLTDSHTVEPAARVARCCTRTCRKR